jgi:hypothetical protein
VKSKKNVKMRGLLMAAVLVLLFSGCMSGPEPYPRVNNDSMKKKELASPDTHTLMFGFVSRAKGIFSLGEPQIPSIEFAQINPEGEAMFVSPGRNNSFFFLQPVPLGSTMHLVYYTYKSGRTVYYSREGLQKGNDLTVHAAEPGLYYAGSYVLTSVEENYGFHRIGEHTELLGLQELLKKMKKTEWEPVIQARMEELSDED